jgi:5-methylcytosine-specific restriction endonuclease McrA
MSKKYSDLLKDPRWQKKRLEILQRDNFTCQLCGDTEATLHIHHKGYIAGNDPWDYSNDLLITFCEDCHEVYTNTNKENRNLVYKDVRAIYIKSDEGFKLKAYRYKDRDILVITKGNGFIINKSYISKIKGFIKNINHV